MTITRDPTSIGRRWRLRGLAWTTALYDLTLPYAITWRRRTTAG